MSVGVVIPVGPGRAENLWDCLERLQRQPDVTDGVVVFDGPEAFHDFRAYCDSRGRFEDPELPEDMAPLRETSVPYRAHVLQQKHEPGREQPRNVGVRLLDDRCDAVWFVDSDVLVEDDCLAHHLSRWRHGGVSIGPYDWMPPGYREPQPSLYNDPRWAMFDEERWARPTPFYSAGELNVGLACFSGNLVWDRREFERVGGFWSEIHHGRCEDGELGLRAVAMGVPITCAPLARGYHMYHDINHDLAIQRNARDVPMLNSRHPWVEGQGLFVVERDGKRFEELCPVCNELINTGEIWQHRATCH